AAGCPGYLRLASSSMESSSPALGLALGVLPLGALGDCELPDGAPPREQLDAARADIGSCWRPGLLPFMLGGDHTATVSAVGAVLPSFPDPPILQLDAHPDLRDELPGYAHHYASRLAL